MKKRNKKMVISLLVLIMIVILIGAFAVKSANTTPEKTVETSNKSVENKTDMEALKSSEYTNKGFKQVELGDSKSDVESKMGTLKSVDIESENDVYSVEDNGTIYYFYFDGDSLVNVSVFLK